MGIRVTNYEAFDTGSSAIGVSIPFNNNQGVFNQTYTSRQQIKSNIVNFILTQKGERPLNTNFGFNLGQYMFGNISSNTLIDLEGELLDALKTNFPETLYSINFTSVKANPNYDDNSISIAINYNFFGESDLININV